MTWRVLSFSPYSELDRQHCCPNLLKGEGALLQSGAVQVDPELTPD